MPEAVTTFIETKQIGKVLNIQRRIIDEYKADMIKYALPADKSRIRECFESIPAQLAREYKKVRVYRRTARSTRQGLCRQSSMDRGCRHYPQML